jgi:hypothetical protein
MSLPATNKVSTPGTVTVGVASAALLAANPRRRWAIICNSGANGLWLGFDATAVVGTGVYVPPNGGTFTIEGENRWKGAVTGIVAAATSVVGLMELQ